MSNKSILITGVLVLVVGLIGVGVIVVLDSTALQPGPLYTTDQSPVSSDSLGEGIYLTGTGATGAIPRTGGIGRMGSGGCVTCHGEDGRGGQIGMMRDFARAPSITYEDLTGEHEDGDASWTDADIARAIRAGTEPDGDTLDDIMPRWDMSDAEMDALIEYLKTL